MTDAIIDDLTRSHGLSAMGTRWQLVSDGVMGGLSQGTLTRETVLGRPALRLRGDVSLANNGGFLQMALDLAPDGGPFDARAWAGVEIEVTGNAETYGVHLRTLAARHPWQSWRSGFASCPEWRRLKLAFAGFAPHRIDVPLDPAGLRRIGLVAIGRAFHADLSVGAIHFYR